MLLRLLADGQPHTFGEIYAKCAHLIAPERAIRRSGAEYAEGAPFGMVVAGGRRGLLRDHLRTSRAHKQGRGRMAIYQLRGEAKTWVDQQLTAYKKDKKGTP